MVACAQVDIDTVQKFESLRAAEQQYFVDMVQKCKDAGVCWCARVPVRLTACA
jgi:hypothetical protein